jgi:hypothetical protein
MPKNWLKVRKILDRDLEVAPGAGAAYLELFVREMLRSS